jgi:hypothetical protein
MRKKVDDGVSNSMSRYTRIIHAKNFLVIVKSYSVCIVSFVSINVQRTCVS